MILFRKMTKMLKFVCGVSAVMLTIAASAGIVRWNNVPDCRDQAFWSKLKSHRQYENLIRRADEMAAAEPVSPLPWYLECSQTGNRSNYERRHNQLRMIGPLVVAYCTTGNVKYLKNIEARFKIILSLPTWGISAHDRQLKGYKQQEVLIDLFSAKMGSEVAAALCILEPVLDKRLYSDMRKALFHHIIDPIEEVVEGKSPADRFWWLDGSNNWNPICKEGVISTILRVGLEKERIEKILKLFFNNFERYMANFGNEGYCDEGLSYWSGSCGKYLSLAALLKQYDGRDVLSREPRMLKAVMFPENIMMAPDCYPALNDCRIDTKPPEHILQLRDILLGKRNGFSEDIAFADETASICLRLNYPIDNRPSVVRNETPFSKFVEAGCFVMRQTAASPLSVTFEGGHNRESHNHNDLGTYIIAVNGVPMVVDPGRGGYTADTFGPRRYTSNLLNSYGHSVPRINGRLQTNRVGGDAFNPPKNLTPIKYIQAVLLKHELSAERGFVKFDISRGYNQIKSLKKLERSLLFDRKDGGKITVTDEAAFSEPAEFEGAVITLSKITELGDNKYLLQWDGKHLGWSAQQLMLEVKSSVPYKFSIDTINEDTWHKLPVCRLAFTAAEKCKNIKMEFIYTPVK